jgi:probable HAF family extracellular repeat protein
MKITNSFKAGGFVLAAALSAGLSFVSPAFGQTEVHPYDPDISYIIDTNSGELTLLGTLGGDSTRAYGINDAGQVVGYSTTTEEGQWHAFITDSNGADMTDLGTLGGYDSFAHGINDAGQVVGTADRAEEGPLSYAFITGPNGVNMTYLGTLGVHDSHAFGINGAGRVVGNSYVGLGRHAFITGPNGADMTDLGTLGGYNSFAYGINDAGQVVGNYFTAEGVHPFITGPDGEGMVDLNSLVDLPDGVILTRATGINNNGQVIAVGVIPEPETYALLLAGLGLVGFMAKRKKIENLKRY